MTLLYEDSSTVLLTGQLRDVLNAFHSCRHTTAGKMARAILCFPSVIKEELGVLIKKSSGTGKKMPALVSFGSAFCIARK